MIHLTMSNHEKYKYAKAWPKSVKDVQPVFNLNIRGDEYRVYLVLQSALDKQVEGAQACMDFEDKTIYHTLENLTITNITHELLHCYIAATYIHELVDLSKDDFEEIMCEVVSRSWHEIGQMAGEVKEALEIIKLQVETEYIESLPKRRKNVSK